MPRRTAKRHAPFRRSRRASRSSEKKSGGLYAIGVVAARYDVHPQTLRIYEREGLLVPARSEGNTRLYSDENLETLEFILNLTRGLGVNLAGIEVVLHMRERMLHMQSEVERLLQRIQQEWTRRDRTPQNALARWYDVRRVAPVVPSYEKSSKDPSSEKKDASPRRA